MSKIRRRIELHVHKIDPDRVFKRLGLYSFDTGFVIDRGIRGVGLQLWWFGVRVELHRIVGARSS